MKRSGKVSVHCGSGLGLLRNGGRVLCAALALAGSSAVYAELSEPVPPAPNPDYFNLFSTTYGSGSGALTGDLSGPTDSVWLCGTENCGPGNEDSGGYGYAEFSIDNTQPAGSGAIDPFLRLQHNDGSEPGKGSTPIEQAYNTNNDNLQEIGDSNGFGDTSTLDNFAKDTGAGAGQANVYDDFNHAIQWETMFIDSEGYLTFLLDINEPGTTCNNGGSNCDITSTLRIDELSFFISTTNDLSFFESDIQDSTVAPADACSGPDGTIDNMCAPTKAQGNFNQDPAILDPTNPESVFKFWDMDWDENYAGLLADNLNDSGPGQAGSGDIDVMMRVPVTNELQQFADAHPGEELFVYLYTFMGEADDLFVDGGKVGSPNDPSGPCDGPPGQCKTPDPDTGVATAGFEELLYVAGDDMRPPEPPQGVPVPSTAFLMLIGALGIWRQRSA